MADEVIKSFLVALGVKVDEQGLKRLHEHIEKTEKTVKHFAIGFSALAVGIEEAIRRVGRQFEQLFYLSQQTGVAASNLKSMQFAFDQIGVGADKFNAAVRGLNQTMIESPGMRLFIHGLAPSFNAATGTAEEGLESLAKRYKELQQIGGSAGAAALAQYHFALKAIGVDPMMVKQTADNIEDLLEYKERALKIIKELYGSTATFDTQTKEAQKSVHLWGLAYFQLKMSFDKLTASLLTSESFQHILKTFSEWMDKTGIPMVKGWADKFDAWLKNDASQKNFQKNLCLIGEAATGLGKAILWLIERLVDLNEHIGATGTLLVALFGFTFAKAAIGGLTKSAIAAIFAPLVSGAGTAGAAAGASFAGAQLTTVGKGLLKVFRFAKFTLAGLAASEAINFLLTPDTPKEKHDVAPQDRGGFLDQTMGRVGRYIRSEHPWLSNLLGDRPHTYSGPPMPVRGGPNTLLEAMVYGFQHWWAGSNAYRPLFALVDDTYDKFADMLRDVFMLHPGSGTGPGTTGPGGSVGSGKGGGGAGGGPIKGGGQVPKGTGFSLGMLKQLALDVGFPPEDAAKAAATWMHESSGNPWAHGDKGIGGSYGLTQIFAGAHGEEAEKAMGDPVWAARKAFELYQNRKRRGGTGFEDWSSYTKGFYRQYMPAAQAATPQGYPTREQLAGGASPSATPGGGGSALSGALPAAAQAVQKVVDAVIGDSIAVGVARSLGVPSDAVSGSTPQEIHGRIMGHVKDFAGKTVGVFSGSNPNQGYDPKQMRYVHDTMTALHGVGAKMVVAGVGHGVKDAAKINAQLSEYAKEFGAPFTGELAGTQRRGGVVHPDSYQKTIDQMKAVHPGRSAANNKIDSSHVTNVTVYSSNPDRAGEAVASVQDRASLYHAKVLGEVASA